MPRMYWFTIWFSALIGAVIDRIIIAGKITVEELALIMVLLFAITVNEKTALLEDLLKKNARVAISLLTIVSAVLAVLYVLII